MSGQVTGIDTRGRGRSAPGRARPAPERARVKVLLLGVLLGALVAAVLTVSGGRAEAQTPPGPTAAPAPGATSGGGVHRLVALGDSWAAGSATATDPADEACRRSPRAYPALVGPVLVGRDWVNAACATARGGPNTQFDALDPATSMVAVTVGADATGLGTLARACGSAGDVGACDAASIRFDRAVAALPRALDASLTVLRARVPGARVVVTGHPALTEGLACLAGPADLARALRLDAAAARLDAVLADRARVAGMLFADVRPVFAGHGVCGPAPWISGFAPEDALLAAAPTAVGQDLGYGAVVQRVLAAVPATTLPTPTSSSSPIAPVPATTLPVPATTPPAPATVPAAPRTVDGLLEPLFAL